MGCLDKMNFLRHFIFGVVLGTFNLISSVVNIYFLFKEEHNKYGSTICHTFYMIFFRFAVISLCLLWFPGIVTSLGFLVLYARGNKTILR